MVMYRARTWWEPSVKALEVVKLTQKTVTYLDKGGHENRENIHSSGVDWFHDFNSAKDHVVRHYGKKFDDAKKLFDQAKALEERK